MKRSIYMLSLLTVFSLLLVACGDKETGDLLARIEKRGIIRVSTDANYAPQSFLKADGDFVGFDIDVAKEIANRLGVKVKFVTPDWALITAGNWGNKWDMSVGSMMITKRRQEAFDFAMPPYYYTFAQLAAANDSGVESLEDIAGQKVCVGASTTYENWLEGDLEKLALPDESSLLASPPTGVTPLPLPTDNECVLSIQAGRKDFVAFLTSNTVVESAIKKGVPIHKVGSPVFVENLAVAFDTKSTFDNTRLVQRVSKIIAEMHKDGTLRTLSMKWFDGLDLTKDPAK
ncbi:MAG: transporter substrate-binding domain-containing protein [Candidatus Poribacteria bacterium]